MLRFLRTNSLLQLLVLAALALACARARSNRDLPVETIKLPLGFTISVYAGHVPGARRLRGSNCLCTATGRLACLLRLCGRCLAHGGCKHRESFDAVGDLGQAYQRSPAQLRRGSFLGGFVLCTPRPSPTAALQVSRLLRPRHLDQS